MQSIEWIVQRLGGKSLALVGGAQSIYDNDFGAQIDAAEVVVRMNRNYPTRARHQGKKTDLLTVSCSVSRWRYWTAYRCPPVLWMSPRRDSIPSWLKKRNNLCLYPLEDWQALSDDLNGARPSTGAMTFDLIVNHLRPDKLSLFGFDFKKTATVHEKKPKLGPHDWEAEQNFFLAQLKKAQDSGRDWNIYH